jgi:cation transport regulator ChaC
MKPRRNRQYPLSLTDAQMQAVMAAAQSLTPNQRYAYLLRLEAALKRTRISMPSDALLGNCVQAALNEALGVSPNFRGNP